MLGEDDQFFAQPVSIKHALSILQQTGKLLPFAIGAADTHRIRHALQFLQRRNFRFKLRYAGRRAGPVRHLFLGFLKFGGGQVVIIVLASKRKRVRLLPAPLAKTFFGQPIFQSSSRRRRRDW